LTIVSRNLPPAARKSQLPRGGKGNEGGKRGTKEGCHLRQKREPGKGEEIWGLKIIRKKTLKT